MDHMLNSEDNIHFQQIIDNYTTYLSKLAHTSLRRYKLRFLFTVYTFCCPGKTQLDFAKILGISQMALSRALTNDISVKEEWEDRLREVFSCLPTTDFCLQAERFLQDQERLTIAKRRYILFELVIEFLFPKYDIFPQFDIELFDETASFYLYSPSTKERRLFIDYDSLNDSSALAQYPLPFSKLDPLCESNDISKVTLFTTSEYIFEQLIGKFMLLIGQENHSFPNRYFSIMYLSELYPSRAKEYVLIKGPLGSDIP